MSETDSQLAVIEDIEVDEGADDEGLGVVEYDITSTPNDFNVVTIVSFLEAGSIRLPPFQRHFTWDKQKASRLIESIIRGLPIPQLFLYEQSGKFLVLDGQQRLLSIFFFCKSRFPRKDTASVFHEHLIGTGTIPDEILFDNSLFRGFDLSFRTIEGQPENPLNGLNYNTLEEFKDAFDLRPIRVVVIKQNKPENDISSIYEIYDRLNTGGINLSHQEIRANLFYSDFLKMLYEINKNDLWRRIYGKEHEEQNMKDVEALMRAVALTVMTDQYKPSMQKFLNAFALHGKRKFDENDIKVLQAICETCSKNLAPERQQPSRAPHQADSRRQF